jgi:5-(carboxyamino)imidazole ribonucleotide synthase
LTLLPPAAIGIIGGGQLGMMIIREAQRMGYRSIVWDRDESCPAARLADETILAPFDDLNAAQRLAEAADVVTYEFEHINADVVRWIEARMHVHPDSRILSIAQHRRMEKEELRRRGFPLANAASAVNIGQLEEAVRAVGFPAVVKTATAGYDGKGQTVLHTSRMLEEHINRNNSAADLVVEEWLSLQCELSVVAVRGRDGTVRTFPVSENVHRNNILHTCRIPARVSDPLRANAERLAVAIIESFQVVGLLCVEMFVTSDGRLLVNELAPRPHNSGHYTLDACSISQFEALVRAICNLPIPSPQLLAPCAMVNILGKHLARLPVPAALSVKGAKLHLYGKARIEEARKMGHITVVRETPEDVESALGELTSLINEPDHTTPLSTSLSPTKHVSTS